MRFLHQRQHLYDFDATCYRIQITLLIESCVLGKNPASHHHQDPMAVVSSTATFSQILIELFNDIMRFKSFKLPVCMTAQYAWQNIGFIAWKL